MKIHSLFARHTQSTLTIPTPFGDHVKGLKWIWPCQESNRHIQRDQKKSLVVQMYAFMAMLTLKEVLKGGFEDDGIDKADSVVRAQ